MMEKVWRRKLDYKPKHTTSSVKHGAGIDTACMAASGTKLIEFTNDLTDDRRSISTILQTQYLQSTPKSNDIQSWKQKTQQTSSTEGGCSEGLAERLMGGNGTLRSLLGARLHEVIDCKEFSSKC